MNPEEPRDEQDETEAGEEAGAESFDRTAMIPAPGSDPRQTDGDADLGPDAGEAPTSEIVPDLDTHTQVVPGGEEPLELEAPYSLAPDPEDDDEGPDTSRGFMSWLTPVRAAAVGLVIGLAVAVAAGLYIASGETPDPLPEISISSSADGEELGLLAEGVYAQGPDLAEALKKIVLEASRVDEGLVSNARHIEIVDLTGDGRWDVALLSPDGSVAIVDGRTAIVVRSADAPRPADDGTASWSFRSGRLILRYRSVDGRETEVAFAPSGAAALHGELLGEAWSAARPGASGVSDDR